MTPLSSVSQPQTTCHMVWDKLKRSQMWWFVTLLSLSAYIEKAGAQQIRPIAPLPYIMFDTPYYIYRCSAPQAVV